MTIHLTKRVCTKLVIQSLSNEWSFPLYFFIASWISSFKFSFSTFPLLNLLLIWVVSHSWNYFSWLRLLFFLGFVSHKSNMSSFPRPLLVSLFWNMTLLLWQLTRVLYGLTWSPSLHSPWSHWLLPSFPQLCSTWCCLCRFSELEIVGWDVWILQGTTLNTGEKLASAVTWSPCLPFWIFCLQQRERRSCLVDLYNRRAMVCFSWVGSWEGYGYCRHIRWPLMLWIATPTIMIDTKFIFFLRYSHIEECENTHM